MAGLATLQPMNMVECESKLFDRTPVTKDGGDGLDARTAKGPKEEGIANEDVSRFKKLNGVPKSCKGIR